MKLLVTGKQGQVAQSLARTAASRPWLTVERVGRPEADMEVAGSIGAAIKAARPDVVINAAAYTAVDEAEEERGRAFRVNAEAAGEIAEVCAAIAAPLIHLSTDYVFDGRATSPYRDDAAASPLGVYGQSKWEGEQRVRAATDDHLIVRTAWVYSPFGRNFVRAMMSLAARQNEVSVVSDQRGSPTNALDFARGLLAIADAWRSADRIGLGSTYHLAGAGEASWSDLACEIMDERARLGLSAPRVTPIVTADWPTTAERPAYSVLDSSRFERDFGFAMPDWRASVRSLVREIAEQERLGE